jgi:uncharacterized membrane protein
VYPLRHPSLTLPVEGRGPEEKNEMRKTLGVWKTTILGGVFFLLPFAVVVFLVGQLSVIVAPLAAQIHKQLEARGRTLTFGNVSLATVLAILLLILICYLAGLAARSAFAARFSGKIEKTIIFLFPRYAILKDQMASNMGGHAIDPTMKPVLVRLEGVSRLGFETARAADGTVTVFFPGSPDPWQGHLAVVAPDRVEAIAADFGAAVSMCESLGRNPPIGGRAEPAKDMA